MIGIEIGKKLVVSCLVDSSGGAVDVDVDGPASKGVVEEAVEETGAAEVDSDGMLSFLSGVK